MITMKPWVLLVQPHTNIFDSGKSRPTLPLSLLSAARQLPEGIQVRLVDCRGDNDWRSSIEALLRQEPLCVGVTSITGNQLFSALAVSRFVRERSSIPVVWGGIHASLFPDQVLDEPSIDIVVRKEGEETFPELVRALLGEGELGVLPGISYCADGEIHHNPDRDFTDMDSLEEVPYDLVGQDPSFITLGRKTLYFETSRGCFSKCAYCYNAEFHKRSWRGQSANKVLDRFDELKSRYPDIGHLSLVDDNYFGDPYRVKEITEGLIERIAPYTYQVQGAHIGMIHKMHTDELALLKRSGCVRLDMGVESASTSVLKAMHKQITSEQVLEINRKLLKVGITPWYNFMIGFPGESPEDVTASCRLVMRIMDENRDSLISPMYRVVPYPGTELYETAARMGFNPPDSLEGWRNFHLDGVRIPWQSRRMMARMRKLYFLSIFLDHKLEIYESPMHYRLLARLYRPFARFRWRTGWLRLMPEEWIFKKLFNIS